MTLLVCVGHASAAETTFAPILPADIKVSADGDVSNFHDMIFDGSRYVVVWTSHEPGRVGIQGQFIGTDGQKGASFLIADSDAAMSPRIARAGTGYLVVYFTNHGISGSIVDVTGTVGPIIKICDADNTQSYPAVISGGSNLLVVWMDSRTTASTGADVYGRFMTTSGAFVGDDFRISLGSGYQSFPIGSFNGQDYVVFWTQEPTSNSNAKDLYGARVSQSGAVLDTEGIPICTAAASQSTFYRVACTAGPNGQTGVTWVDSRTGRDVLYFARISNGGAVLDGPASSSGLTVFQDTYYPPDYPQVTYNGREYVLFFEYKSRISAALVGTDGSVRVPQTVPVTYGRDTTSSACGSDGTNYLVSWATYGTGQIFAQLVTDANQVPVAEAGPGSTFQAIRGSGVMDAGASTDPDGDLPLQYYWNIVSKPANSYPNLAGGSTQQATLTTSYPGEYIIELTVTDAHGAVSQPDQVAFTVTPYTNQAPVLDPIEPQTVTELQQLTIQLTGSDPDGDAVEFGVSYPPTGATFDTTTRTFTWTPTASQAGTYNVQFWVRDTTHTYSVQTVTITVVNLNQPPVLDVIGSKIVAENVQLTFTVSATDPDISDTLTYSATGVPTWATFNPLTRTFTGTPGLNDAGSSSVTFSVTDGTDTDSEIVIITVENVNSAPTAAFTFLPATPTTTDPVQFTGSALDADGTVTGWSWSFADGTAISTDPNPTHTFATAGMYAVTLTVTDNSGGASVPFTRSVTVTDPVPVAHDDAYTTLENQDISKEAPGVLANDEFNAVNGATAAVSTGPNHGSLDLEQDGSFVYSPETLFSGTDSFTYTLTSGSQTSGPATVIITVTDVNNMPMGGFTLSPNAPTTNDLVQFTDCSSDTDGTIVGWAWSFGDGTSSNEQNPTHTFTPARTYTVNLLVTDNDGGSGSHTLDLIVSNPKPVANDDAYTVNQGDSRTLEWPGVLANDEYLVILSLATAQLASDAVHGTLVLNADGSFTYTPDAGFSGTDTFTYIARSGTTDGSGSQESEPATVTITVNALPIAVFTFSPDTPTTHDTVTFAADGSSDPDGTVTGWSWDFNDGSAVFQGNDPTVYKNPTHTYTSPGMYDVKLTVTDDDGATATATRSVTVTQANRDPVLESIGAKNVAEGMQLQFSVSATDPDTGDTLTYSASNLPPGATFDPATRTFTWTPTSTQAGTYPNVRFEVTDNSLSDFEEITITVENVNTAPVLDVIGAKTVAENVQLAFTVSATDSDSDALIYSATGLPTGASFDPATRTFTWTPTSTQAGTYPNVRFEVTDNSLSDFEEITITVENVNTAPVANGQTVTTSEDAAVAITLTGSDVEGSALTYSVVSGPAHGALSGAAPILTYTPAADFSGPDSFMFRVHDGELYSTAATISITVTDVNDPPTVDFSFSPSAPTTTDPVQFTGSSLDADGTVTGWSWSFGTDGTATVQNPSHTFATAGTYDVTLTVTDDDSASATMTHSVTVTSGNLPPVVDAGVDTTGTEGTAVAFSGGFTDPGDTGTHSITWAFGDGTTASALETTHAYADNGAYIATLTVTDAAGLSDSDTRTVTVGNADPVVTGVTVPADPVAVRTSVIATATFTDAGTADTHTATWNWGDGTTTDGTVTGGSVTGTHAYTVAGVYEVEVTVTDNNGGAGTATAQAFLVAYDPNGGFVTGGGWIQSPAGAYTADPAMTGRANFGFVSKYQKGATVPTGQTQFEFKAADLAFQSTSYDWLVIAGAKAQYKGVGTINGGGNYGFMLTAIDGDVLDKGKPDLFRLKIWDAATNTIVYDNKMDAPDTDDPTTVLGGGSIVVHKK